MAKYSHIILITLGFMLFIERSYALQCYRCTGENGNDCYDPFKTNEIEETLRNTFIDECHSDHSQNAGATPPNFACKKQVIAYNGKQKIIRECVNLNDNRDYCAPTDNLQNAKKIFCETCNTNLCNGAMGNGALATIVLLCAAVLFKLQ